MILDAQLTVGRIKIDISDTTLRLTIAERATSLRPDEARAVAAALVAGAGALDRPRFVRRRRHVDDELRSIDD
jgi:hypothetical protein